MSDVVQFAARSHFLGLGPAESLVILMILLTLAHGHGLAHEPRGFVHRRLSRAELCFAVSLGLGLLAAVAVLVRQSLVR